MSILNWLKWLSTGKYADLPSPSDIFKNTAVIWDSSYFDAQGQRRIKKGALNIPFAEDPIAIEYCVPDTRSMEPVFAKEGHIVYLQPANATDYTTLANYLNVGDIAVYQYYPGRYDTGYAVHRIVKKGFDNEGRFFRFKGDHPTAPIDPWVVRDNMLKLLLGIIVY